MRTYYAVGKAMQTESERSVIFNQSPLKLDYETFMSRAFPEGKIDLIFTTLENANLYVTTCMLMINDIKYRTSTSSSAPVVTFATEAELPEASDTNFTAKQKVRMQSENAIDDSIDTGIADNNVIKSIPALEFGSVPYNNEVNYIEAKLEKDLVLPTVNKPLLFSDVKVLKVEFPIAKVKPQVELEKSTRCSLM